MARTASTAMVEIFRGLFLEPVSSNVEHKDRKSFPYISLIWNLPYFSTQTRPVITFSVGILSKLIRSPTIVRWLDTKLVLRYLHGTQEAGITIGTATSESRVQNGKFTKRLS